jgi:thiol-disulfide isomerase/thioredoxin
MRRLLLLSFLGLFVSVVSAGEVPSGRTLPVGTIAPRLDLKFLDGSDAPSWPALRGKVVIVDFWASWCGPCVGAIPHLDDLKKELANEPVEFFSITYEPKAKALAFLAKHPMSTTVGVDNDLATFASFIAWGIPMTYVVGRDGRIAAVVSPAKLTAADVRAVLAGKKPGAEPHPGWPDPAGAAKYFREQLTEDRKTFGSE